MIDAALPVVASVIGVIISVLTLHGIVNKNHKQEHTNVSNGIVELKDLIINEITKLSTSIHSLSLDLARNYVTQQNLSNALQSIKEDIEEIVREQKAIQDDITELKIKTNSRGRPKKIIG